MQTCGPLLDDEDSARILKEVKGIGTETTRADAFRSFKIKQLN